uniref:Uncharacterized protein n=1 Tax=Rousettus aegyptiacus TaxID=9407 RepID=A0A7J8C2I0_ROUAE|nr:hypothetical protein HJG63_009352 [Rousettus aegyptiacus]
MSFCRLTISLLKFSLSFLSILISSVLNSISDRLLVSVTLRVFFFSGYFSCGFLSLVLFVWNMFLCFLILAASLCFYVLSRSPISLSLHQVTLCSRCPSGTVSLITYTMSSRSVSCISVYAHLL